MNDSIHLLVMGTGHVRLTFGMELAYFGPEARPAGLTNIGVGR